MYAKQKVSYVCIQGCAVEKSKVFISFFFFFTTPTQVGLGSLQRFLYVMTNQFKNTVVLEFKFWNYLSAWLIFKHKIGRERRKNIEESIFMRVYVQV